MSLRTSFWLLPQNEHFSVPLPSRVRAIGSSLLPYFLSAAAASAACSLTGRVVGFDAMTSSTILYSFACSAVMKKSRSVSRSILSIGCPV